MSEHVGWLKVDFEFVLVCKNGFQFWSLLRVGVAAITWFLNERIVSCRFKLRV